MYFILAAQFESFVQPLIVLLEIPIDVAFALLLLDVYKRQERSGAFLHRIRRGVVPCGGAV